MIIDRQSKRKNFFFIPEAVKSVDTHGLWVILWLETADQELLDNGTCKYTTKDGRQWIGYSDC